LAPECGLDLADEEDPFAEVDWGNVEEAGSDDDDHDNDDMDDSGEDNDDEESGNDEDGDEEKMKNMETFIIFTMVTLTQISTMFLVSIEVKTYP
jgi:hypothetical protein